MSHTILSEHWHNHTCIVTSLSSTITSLVRKSAPMVALYWLLNFLLTYWFIKDVLPTLVWCAMVSCQFGFHGCVYKLSFTRCRLEWWPTEYSFSHSQLVVLANKDVYLEKNFFTWSHCREKRTRGACMSWRKEVCMCGRNRNSSRKGCPARLWIS